MLPFPDRTGQNCLSLSQQTEHSSIVLCTNKQIVGTIFSTALKHSSPSQPRLPNLPTTKNPRGGEMNLGLCVFKLFPTSSTPAAFLHQRSLGLLPSFSFPHFVFYLKTNWQAGVWTMLWGPRQSPTPFTAALDWCCVRLWFPDIVRLCSACVCVCHAPFRLKQWRHLTWHHDPAPCSDVEKSLIMNTCF